MKVNTYSVKSDGNLNISKNFKIKEFRCKDGSDKVLIDVDFIKDNLQKIRDYFGQPVTVTSGYRTEAYNKTVGGAANSYHVKGRAFDIQISGAAPLKVAQYAESIGVLGIIVYPTFTHLDSRTSKYFSNDSGRSPCQTFGGQQPAGSVTDSRTETIKRGQHHSIIFTGRKISMDGKRGPDTIKQGGIVLQTALNLDYKAGLSLDGIVGAKTKNTLEGHYVKKGEKQYMVTAAEILLMLKGYNPGGVESPGRFGQGLESCVKGYQKNVGLSATGICDKGTFLSLVL